MKQEHIFVNDDSISSAGILMRKKNIAIIALAVWLISISVFMFLAQHVDLEIFFVLFFIGILVMVYLMELNFVQPGYLLYMRYLIAVGIVIFSAILAQKAMEIL
jgi:hypothetical protein